MQDTRNRVVLFPGTGARMGIALFLFAACGGPEPMHAPDDAHLREPKNPGTAGPSGNVDPPVVKRELGAPRTFAFTDVAASAGIATIRRDVPDFFDVHAEDYDGDGWADVFLSDHRTSHRLAMNDRSGRFVRGALPSSNAQVWSMMATDYDNDGRLDLSTNWDSASIKIYRNDGRRTFSAVTASASYESQANGMAWADWNADGYPDYMVSGFFGNRLYAGGPSGYTNASSNASDVTSAYSQASLYLADLDGDRAPDIFLQPTNATSGAGIFTPSVTHTTQILFNKWAGFRAPVSNGLEACPAPAVAFGDYDLDGDLDVFCAGSAASGPAAPRKTFRTRLYRNQGNGTFTDVTSAAGIPMDDYPVNEYRVIYAQSAFADFDNDGRLDLVWIEPEPRGIHLFQNTGAGFRDVTAASGIASYKHDVPRFMVADFDRDGSLDIVSMVGAQTPKVSVFKNSLAPAGWLDIVLTGSSLKTAIGSKIHIYQSGHAGDAAYRVGYREVLLAHSHRSPLEQHFGVPSGGTYDIRVEFWPQRNVVDIPNVAPGRRLKIAQSGTSTTF